ncbi:phiSA1p31-related protein [Streptomyces sp. NPDC058280]|uniref:phiSA1p31-related protein n=1 Tax=Streptomyces sp. NPDC058280 TaxID=3346419 RepID=UPI0036ECCFFB
MAEQTFKVGDKVRVLSGGDGKVTYGPVNSTFGTYKMFVVKQDGDEERAFKSADLEPLPTFAVGDSAKMVGESDPVEIVGGPFTNRYHTWFAVRAEIGETIASEDNLTVLPAPDPIDVGDRVRVTDDDGGGANRFTGRIGTVLGVDDSSRLPYHVQFGTGRGYHGDENGRWNCVAVERVTDEPTDPIAVGNRAWVVKDDDTHKHNGVTYDLSARYRDRHGDYWRFERFPDGTVRGDFSSSLTTTPTVGEHSHTLGYVFACYGPLVKI